MNRRVLRIVPLSAAAVLAASVTSASAGRLSLNSQAISATWSPMEFGAGGASVRCNVTLEGSFHSRTLTKTHQSLVGYITRAGLARPCAGGTVWLYNGSEVNEVLGTRLANSLPWHLRYEGFTGTLPTITSIWLELTGMRFLTRATVLGITILCVYTVPTINPLRVVLERNTFSGAVIWANIEAPGGIMSESGGFCPGGGVRRLGTVVRQGEINPVTVTLI